MVSNVLSQIALSHAIAALEKVQRFMPAAIPVSDSMVLDLPKLEAQSEMMEEKLEAQACTLEACRFELREAHDESLARESEYHASSTTLAEVIFWAFPKEIQGLLPSRHPSDMH